MTTVKDVKRKKFQLTLELKSERSCRKEMAVIVLVMDGESVDEEGDDDNVSSESYSSSHSLSARS